MFFTEEILEVAEKNNIPYQIDIMLGGRTAAGKFHLFKKGVPTIVIGIAARYIYSHVLMINKKDLENSAIVLIKLVKEIEANRFNQLFN
ncbi:hypothetical protein [Priestia aryabhattai]|uniref:hypothetical protein n=1 Tax=Priestia aryabhattai TaxID=412384 RepID=UPI003D276714